MVIIINLYLFGCKNTKYFYLKSLLPKKSFFQHQAEAMIDGEVQLLDLIRFGFRYLYAHIGQCRELAFLAAGEADDFHAFGFGNDGGVDDVFAVAGGGDGEESVAVISEAEHLLGEYQLGHAVVHEGGGESRVAGEGDGGQRALQVLRYRSAHLPVDVFTRFSKIAADGAREFEPFHQLADNMFGIGGGTTVAGHQQFVLGEVRLLHQQVGLCDGILAALQGRVALQQREDMVLKFVFQQIEHKRRVYEMIGKSTLFC